MYDNIRYATLRCESKIFLKTSLGNMIIILKFIQQDKTLRYSNSASNHTTTKTQELIDKESIEKK